MYSVQLLSVYILQCIAVIILNCSQMNFERIICVDLKLLINTSGTIVPYFALISGSFQNPGFEGFRGRADALLLTLQVNLVIFMKTPYIEKKRN